MVNLFRADLYKFKKSKGLKVYILLSFLCITILAVILYKVADGTMSKDILQSVSLLIDAIMVSLLASLMIGSYICGDFQSKTIHSEVSCTTRGKVILMKCLSSMFATSLITLPYAIVAVICFISKMKFAQFDGIPSLFIGILNNSKGIEVTVSSVAKSIVLVFVGILLYAARLSICIPVAFKVRKSVVVMAVGIAAAFGFDMVTQMLKDVAVIGTIFDNTPYAVIYDLSMTASVGTIIRAVIDSIVFILVMIGITYAMFRKAEIK